MNKKHLSTLLVVLITLFFYLTVGFIAAGIILNAVAGQTNNTASVFGSWWQVLIFVADIVVFLGIGVVSFFLIRISRKDKDVVTTEVKKSKIRKLFSLPLWSFFSLFFGILFLIFYIASEVAPQNSYFINEYFKVRPFEIVNTGEAEPFNEYPSDYLNEDGSFDNERMRKNSEKVALQTATEGSVLLWNDNALPLAANAKISYFGISSSKYLFSAAGSGHLGVSTTDNLVQTSQAVGLVANPSLANAYKLLSSEYGNYNTELGFRLDGSHIGDKCYVEYGINEVPWNQLDSTIAGNATSTISSYGDAAILIISRNDGEDGDTLYDTSECIENNYLDLANKEIEILNNLHDLKSQGKVKKIVLVINAAQPLQMKHIKDMDIDACLWAGVGGNMSLQQIPRLLSGKDNPSGRLIDTYLYDNDSAPAVINQGNFEFPNKSGLPGTSDYSHSEKYLVYAEGIYVGYRYFETRYEDAILNRGNANSTIGAYHSTNNWKYSEEVAFPFGYGNSYTTFSHTDFSVTKNLLGDYECSVKITNTGSVAGKEVAQFYLQKPYTQYDIDNAIEKSSVELAGFGKTKLLAPGEYEVVKATIKQEDFKSYDPYNKKTYIVETGDYYITEGLNAHNAVNNILASKGKTVSDGMDENGDSNKAYKINYTDSNILKYSKAIGTDYVITNQFNNADPKLYEGTKEQFASFKYLTRSDWAGSYPTPVAMNTTPTMVEDLQYAHEVADDPSVKMPEYGREGNLKLIELWGYDYDDAKWDELLNQLTWEEMNAFITTGGGLTGAVSVNAPEGLAKDGPAGIGTGNPTIMCFPCECLMASTFNQELIEDLGNAFGMEIMHVGYHGIYGPGANIHRSNYSGRNWEYYSEDPFISGKMLASEVTGLQHRGIIVFTKHFLLNDQERNRYGIAVFANEQSVREIYLKPFETGVREANMNGIMSSFNRIGCTWSGKHKGLLTEVLRKEWGFIGVVQTDAYVANYMHQAIAESVVAGNDFTMGGRVTNKFDSWKNNAVVVNAMRETCHRILYTKLHSCTMNGLSITTKTIYHTPWWQVTLYVGRDVSLGILIASLVLLIASFGLPFLWKRRDRMQENAIKENRSVKYFFDVISKKATVITSSCTMCIGVVALLIPIIIGATKNPGTDTPKSNVHVCHHVCEVCGKCQDYDCPYVACEEKCSCPCEHACNICGKCVDYDSEGYRCHEKCGEQYHQTLIFEGEDPNTLKYPGQRGNLGIAHETGSTEYYIGGYNANLGAKIKYALYSPADTTATMFVSVCKRNGAQLFTNNIIVTVNGTLVESKGIVPALSGDDKEWVTFTQVCLGCINLVEGRNAIEFIVANDDVASGFNFDKMILKCDEDITFYTGEHQCDHICPTCGLCKDEYCNDPVCENKCTCGLNKFEFGCDNELNVLTGGSISDGKFVTTQAGEKIKFIVENIENEKGVIFLDVDKISADTNISDLYSIKVNDNELISNEKILASGEDVQRVKIGQVGLVYGNNVIEITSKTNTVTKINNLVIGAKKTITFYDPYKFSVDDETVIVTGNVHKTSDHYIDFIVDKPAGSKILFQIDSDKDTTAKLYMNLSSHEGIIQLVHIWKLRINDVEYPLTAILPSGSTLFYEDTLIGEINLINGKNTIEIECIWDSPTVQGNLRYISFRDTDAKLTYSATAIRENELIIEESDVVINAVAGHPSIGNGQGSSNGQYIGGINDAGVFNSGEASIEFNVNCDTIANAKIFVNAGVSGSVNLKNFVMYVNGEKIDSDTIWTGSGWYDWKNHFYSNVELNAGSNNIKFVIYDGSIMNIDHFVVQSLATITL
ncbi:MAG: glycoside hydrolase family 3 C-terminal domain-containing protein [Bacilli bacterium]|nr:glycoside hydrolase family 3 C-terminal domain-containing protein [Bacilli bacterium]